MNIAGITDKGAVRKDNQDRILINRDIGLYIVADGMGGHLHGDLASEMAVKIINEYVTEGILNDDSMDAKRDEAIINLLMESMQKANKEIYEYTEQKKLRDIMGTTATALLIRKDKGYIGHIGDSRIYRLRGEEFTKLTKDHTQAQELADIGYIKQEEIDRHKTSNVLNRALGSREKERIDTAVIDIEEGDKYLLSSDGIFRVLEEERVKAVIKGEGRVEDICNILCEMAINNKVPDNISVIIIEIPKRCMIKGILEKMKVKR